MEHLVPDDLWALIAPLFPDPAVPASRGRPPLHPRRVLAGILYLLRWGLPWRQLPLALGCGSGRTCERRFNEWQRAGLWSRLHVRLLEAAHHAGHLDWTRSALDSASVLAPRGGEHTGANPTDRGKRGSKLHVLIDGQGIPLAITVTGANVHDSRQLEATLDAVPRVRSGRRGRPRCRPAKLHADKGYDYPRCRHAIRRRGIQPRIARRGVESKATLGRHRWRVERTLSWLLAFRRLAVRRERCAQRFLSLAHLACAVIVWRALRRNASVPPAGSGPAVPETSGRSA
ncbi:transposase [Deinococcus metalli]|uniref:Transposase n=2 Tax=Deinococcus metalli TaxID=1141878 RepID=A0A7W8KL73_9DEIO|nr:IS5 family transposase [Deinococcus metalli]MBB5379313.1 transposase [Deinococcus metalli]